jgi:hypothetical protein
VKFPTPSPSLVLLLAIVGTLVVAQQTPLEATDAPPSEEIFPPETAVLSVIKEMPMVVTEGVLSFGLVDSFLQPQKMTDKKANGT